MKLWIISVRLSPHREGNADISDSSAGKSRKPRDASRHDKWDADPFPGASPRKRTGALVRNAAVAPVVPLQIDKGLSLMQGLSRAVNTH